MATSNRRPPEVKRTRTFEGAPAVSVDVFSELEFTAATTFLGEDKFYEKADERETRLRELVHKATARDAVRTAELIAKVRQDYKIRTASALMAVEYVRAGGPNGRDVINAVIQRPDEPAEILAYWQSRYGAERTAKTRNLAGLPNAIRNGVADGLVRQMTERNYLKYVGQGRKLVSIADAIELTHPTPKAPWQSALFKHALDQAHHGDGSTEGLTTIEASRAMGSIPEELRRQFLRTEGTGRLDEAGYNWERLAGWLPGGMDAEAWQAVIPNMGVMALLRNLRNFDQAKISELTQAIVEAKITDVDEVRKSRIFPYRAYQAYTAAPSDRWKHALNKTLALAAGNVPVWDRTLFLVDVSGSMTSPMSGKSQISLYEVAAVMAAAAIKDSADSDLGLFGTNSAILKYPVGTSPLGVVNLVAQVQQGGRLGWGTQIFAAINAHFNPELHERVVVFTDMQTAREDDAHPADRVPSIVYFNLAGYNPVIDWNPRRLHLSGFSDAAFRAAYELTESPK